MFPSPVEGEEEVADTDHHVVPERAQYEALTVRQQLVSSQHQELRQVED